MAEAEKLPPLPDDDVVDLGPSPVHPLPRRASPENSITLNNHRLGREASLRPNVPQSITSRNAAVTPSPRRNSSDESNDTGQSDPTRWFNQTNRNATGNYDSHAMDVDPPFFQRESDSSAEEMRPPAPRATATQSSSAGDYRSVIDDLTIENKRLKEKLKRLEQFGPDFMKKEKLFEIKVHGLSKKKKRELETTLRDFAAALGDTASADASGSSQRKKSSRNLNRLYSSSGSMSKHASSSAGSNSRPVDSAYASASTGHHSSGMSLGRPSMTSRARSSEQKVENYLRDIPEGLYPRHTAMTDKEKKKMVVRRLEQIFTGKITGLGLARNVSVVYPGNANPTPLQLSELQLPQPPQIQQTPQTHTPAAQTALAKPPPLTEGSREAKMLPQESSAGKKNTSRDNLSTSNSNGEDSGGNAPGSSSTSPPIAPTSEQRPTRPLELDPDRVQVPSENMEYLRHLGLVPPELLQGTKASAHDVPTDADGWVYLNLLCNMAQLHIFNVTPDFIRAAVSERSTKFQLSPDGNKIRWRGGCEGTRFSSDSSGDTSQQSPLTDETGCSEKGGRRSKRQKLNNSGDDLTSAPSSKHTSKFHHPQVSQYSSSSFHYKPIFVHRTSSQDTSVEDMSSCDQNEDSYLEESRWGQSGSGSGLRKKRRLDGAIIYYNNSAPFFIDMSGDAGDTSPATYMASAGQEPTESRSMETDVPRRIVPMRTSSGSSLKYRPLSDGLEAFQANDDAGSPDSDEDGDIDMDLSWSDTPQFLGIQPLEPCGLGGVYPEDSFMVVVTTQRPRTEPKPSTERRKSREITDSIVDRLSCMSTSSPGGPGTGRQPNNQQTRRVEIRYLEGRMRRLNPAPLPPPAMFLSPFSTESSYDSVDLISSAEDDDEGIGSAEELMSRRANPHQSDNDYPDDVDITSGDEVGEDPSDDMVIDDLADKSSEREYEVPQGEREQSKGSSAATAGGEESGYNSSAEESPE